MLKCLPNRLRWSLAVVSLSCVWTGCANPGPAKQTQPGDELARWGRAQRQAQGDGFKTWGLSDKAREIERDLGGY